MQKVITINLNGAAYQFDEDAFDTLRRYLDQARLRLKDNPDLAEIMTDLEQAIGEKCQKFLGAHKTVVSASEITQVLDEMGPVDGGEEPQSTDAGSQPGATPPLRDGDAPKRLYQISDGAIISGVCQGIAAYLNVDATLVRLVFVILAVVTKGGFALVYLVMMFVIPEASTSEEHAAAHGAPFNAKEIVDHATSKARSVADQALKNPKAFHADWRKQHRDFRRKWHREHRAWKREWRQSRRRARRWWGVPASAAPVAPPPVGYAAQVTAGVLVPVLSLASAAVFWIWAAAMMSLLATGAIFGRSLPSDLPMWAALLILALLFNMFAWPLHHARQASHAALGGRQRYGSVAAWDGMMGFGFWLLLGWAAYRYIPEVHQFFDNLPLVRDNLREVFGPLRR